MSHTTNVCATALTWPSTRVSSETTRSGDSMRILAFAISVLLCTATMSTSPAIALSAQSCGGAQEMQNGTVRPMLCPNGHPNSSAASLLRRSAPKVMALRGSASNGSAIKAACADAYNGSAQIAYGAYTYKYALHNWASRGFNTPNQMLTLLVSGVLCPSSEGSSASSTRTFQMPDARGYSQSDVEAWKRKNSLSVNLFFNTALGYQYSANCRFNKSGQVVAQRPSAGSTVNDAAGTTLYFDLDC